MRCKCTTQRVQNYRTNKILSFKSSNVFLFDYFFNIYPLGHRLFSLYVLSVITNQEKLVSEIEFLG